MPKARWAAVSVDLDSLPHYCRIHGLSESLLDEQARDLVYAVALPRFLEVFQELGMAATLFVIGEDLDRPVAVDSLKEAAQVGCELASHSHFHDYALSRRPIVEILADLRRSLSAMEERLGARPKGFRAPGYALSSALYRAEEEVGFSYGSSVFPAAPYYAAKALIMGALRISGRPSRAVLDTPRVLLAPKVPYWPNPENPYRRGSGRVLELPVSVSPTVGLPFIGTLALTFPAKVVRGMYRSLRNAPLFNFELHGIDLLDESDGLPTTLVRAQRDLRVPVAKKRARLKEVLSWLFGDFQWATLAQVADRFR